MPSIEFDDEGVRRPVRRAAAHVPPIIFLPAWRGEQLRRLLKKTPSDRLTAEVFSFIYVRTFQVAQYSGTKR